MMDELIQHLKESKLYGADDIEEGDHITGAVVIMRIERLDEEEPSFAVMHTGDYITATGLITLGAEVGLNSIVTEEDE